MTRHQLVAKVLKRATPEQLIRVRHMLESYQNKFGWDYHQEHIRQVLKDFDSGNYDSRRVADWLTDKQLSIALSGEPYRINDYGEVKHASEPSKKSWCGSRGGWYND